MECLATVIVDGYNVIRRVPALARLEAEGLETARNAFEGFLSRYVGRSGNAVTVVYDGTRTADYRRGPLRVIYATSADRRISELAGSGSIVVTSDNEVRAAAEARGSRVASADEFWSRVLDRLQGSGYAGDKNGADEDEDESAGAPRGRRSNRGQSRKLPKSERQKRAQHKKTLDLL